MAHRDKLKAIFEIGVPGLFQHLDLLQELEAIVKKEHGLQICIACPQDVRMALTMIKYLNPMKNEAKQEPKFVMNPNVVLNVRDTGETLSHKNITDERAEKLLRDNPVYAKLFTKIPEGFFYSKAPAKAAAPAKAPQTQSKAPQGKGGKGGGGKTGQSDKATGKAPEAPVAQTPDAGAPAVSN